MIKYGGAAMMDAELKEEFARDVVLLKYVGMNPVVVHGGGPEITGYMERLDLPVQFVDGLRVSDAATVEVAKMVLVGKVNKDIVLRLGRHGQPAVGLCGDDGLLFRASRQTSPSGQDIGFVGKIERVDVDVLNHIAQDYIPVVASVGADRDGNSYNINADEAAGAVARALGAYKIMFLTDVAGWLRDAADPDSVVSQASPDEVQEALESVAGGMRPKLAACLDAIHGGVTFAHIVDGRVPHSLLLELFTDAGQGTKIGMDRVSATSLAELQALEREYAIGTYVRNPVAFVRGQGCTLWDADGNEYLDFLAGISVLNVGHCHPRVVEAVRDQASTLTHATNLYYTEPAMRLSAELSRGSLGGKVFLCNSGTEANEAAIKLARRARSGGKLIVLQEAFHGRTYGSLSATPQESKQAPFAPLVPGFVVVAKDPEALTAAVDGDTAAVLLEPIQGETGINVLSDELLRAAREACDRTGAALVFDEIQTGMGRTGTLWAYEQTRRRARRDHERQGARWRPADRRADHGPAAGRRPAARATTARLSPAVRWSAQRRWWRSSCALIRRCSSVSASSVSGSAAGLHELPGVDEVRGRGLMVGFDLAQRLGARRGAPRAARTATGRQRHRPAHDPARATADRLRAGDRQRAAKS